MLRFGAGGLGFVSPSSNAPALLSPLNADTFEAGDTIILFAEIPEGAPAVSKVEFFEGVTELAEITSEPWTYQVTLATAGAKSYTAKATYVDTTNATSSAAAVTVNAAPSFVPTDVTEVKVWTDPSYTAGLTITSGRVETIVNRHGTSIAGDFTQATSTARPVLGKLRGKQALFFGSGSAERLVSLLTGTQAQPYTLFAALRPTRCDGTGVVLMGDAGGRLQFTGATYPRAFVGGAGGSLSTAIPASTAMLVEFLANGASNSEHRINGVLTAGPGSGGTITLQTNLSMGGVDTGGSGQKMALADIVVAVGALSAPNRAAITDYLMDKNHLGDPAAKVMYVGDSITLGNASGEGNGWRRMIHDNFTSLGKVAGHWLEEVGDVEDFGYAGDCHYGVSGKGITYMRSNLIATIGTTTEQFAPDIMTLLIGTNNTREAAGETWVAGSGSGSTIENYKLLVGEILTKLPNLILVVSTLIPTNDGTYQPRVLEFNSNLPAAWDAIEALYPTATLIRADQSTAMGGPAYVAANSADGIHPNDTGYALMELEWRKRLAKAAAVFEAA